MLYSQVTAALRALVVSVHTVHMDLTQAHLPEHYHIQATLSVWLIFRSRQLFVGSQ